MNPDHARFAEWDSAYVLGALSPAERREYEEHLETCETCRRSRRRARRRCPGCSPASSPERAAGAPRRGARRRLPHRGRETARRGAPGGPAPRHPSHAHPGSGGRGRGGRGRSRDRRCRWRSPGPAACPRVGRVRDRRRRAAHRHGDADPRRVGHEDRARLPLRAPASDATDAADAPDGGWPYALVVVDHDGNRTEVSSWRASPGVHGARSRRAPPLDLDDIASLEIRASRAATCCSPPTPADPRVTLSGARLMFTVDGIGPVGGTAGHDGVYAGRGAA